MAKYQTEQRKFLERIIKHMEQQGEFAMTPCGCVYRSQERKHGKVLRCAVGCLIPKKAYSKYIEGKRVDSTAVLTVLSRTTVDIENVSLMHFLEKMQYLHDSFRMQTPILELTSNRHKTFDEYLEQLKAYREVYD